MGLPRTRTNTGSPTQMLFPFLHRPRRRNEQIRSLASCDLRYWSYRLCSLRIRGDRQIELGYYRADVRKPALKETMPDNDATKIPSRFEEAVAKAPTLTGLRASNTLETLKPREIQFAPPTLETFNESSPGIVLPEPVFVRKDGPYPFIETRAEYEAIVRKTDNVFSSSYEANEYAGRQRATQTAPVDIIKDGEKYTVVTNNGANVLPVDWPTVEKGWQSENKTPKPFLMPSLTDRVQKLEEQVDSLLDRIAKHNQRSSHKI